tara:strand:- start:441 stop:938 length:498 start_codon:yes stop_codon:yes gene_type:complete
MKAFAEIEGVTVQPLKQIEGSGGAVLHMLRKDSNLFSQFGEVYFSEIYPEAIKAWKLHKKQTQNIAVPWGKIQLVIYDSRSTSSTHGKIAEFRLGRPEHYQLIQIPPMLWYGFQGINNQVSIIANCTDQAHNPEESESLPSDSGPIPYKWKKIKSQGQNLTNRTK